MTARVFVPLVGANGEAQQLFEAIASDEAPEAHPAQLSGQISELFDFGLYGIGQTAREAVVRFIAARRGALWLSRRNAVVRPWHLRISDLQVGRLSDENARSAGLGLTLAAICQAFGRPADLVFASGEIVLPTAPGDASVSVGPVGGVRGKLALIGDYFVQHRTALAGKTITLALPATAADGRATRDSEAGSLRRVEAAARDAGAEIQMIFAATLDDFDSPLGPFVLPEVLTVKRAAIAGAAALGLVLVFGAWRTMAHAHVRLAFQTVPGGEAAGPQRARYDAQTDKLVLAGPCQDGQGGPLVVGGETLIVRVGATDSWPWASALYPPRFYIVSVSAKADPVLLDADHFRALGSEPSRAASLQAEVPIEALDDEAELYVAATRDFGLSPAAVQSALRKTVQGVSGPALFTTTTTFLEESFGNVLAYHFKVTNDARACPD